MSSPGAGRGSAGTAGFVLTRRSVLPALPGAASASASNAVELLGREHQARGRTQPQQGWSASLRARWTLAPRDRGPEAGTKASLAMPTIGGRDGFAGTTVLFFWPGGSCSGRPEGAL